MTAGVPLDGSGSGSFSIPEIVALAAEGSIRVPTFQRQFAWTAKDVRQLFDSLYRGFPVGTLLLWRQNAEAGTVSLGPITFDVPARSGAYWVVDGQQRITSLFATLSPRYQSTDERFEVFFDLETQKFVTPRKGLAPPRAIPVRDALESRTLIQWLRNHSDELEAEDFDLADHLAGALRDYRIPAYIVSGDNQELLREVFDRVNSAGKPISRAQVFHALFAGNDEPGSPGSVVAALDKLGFGSIDEGRVVQSLLALRGGDVQRDIRDEFEDGTERPADWFDLTEVALTRAVEFLRSEGVAHQLLMPNTLPLPVLAVFFHLHPNPAAWDKRLLARWLWRGWVHGFGREGGQTPVLRRAIRSVNPELRDPERAPAEYDAIKALLDFTPDRPVPTLPMDGFNTKNANTRLISLALASLEPLDENGNRIDIASEFQKYGSDAVTRFTPEGRSLAANRGFWRADSPKIREIADEKILSSHLIDPPARRALLNSQFDIFIRIRKKALAALVERFLDSRLEPGKRIRPPLRQMAIGDEMDESE
ncbi:DUF262 domain-containing protein [Amycolatopsis pithecellobii]|uniref:DUF262 domain-containing protein n=1 Tax=Amycolatopsis pithecellobii TaxID=664692 RepID=A0A6N7ZAL0_9PSEU|nr:DUF262 domain-containing protein [Amycolatopsis pithecellobii]MTD58773.1 DUF262 domain-containing protein [Amycolatopsis pithecellobii]